MAGLERKTTMLTCHQSVSYEIPAFYQSDSVEKKQQHYFYCVEEQRTSVLENFKQSNLKSSKLICTEVNYEL